MSGQNGGAGAGAGCGHVPEAEGAIKPPSGQPASVRAEGQEVTPPSCPARTRGLALGSAAVMSQRRAVPSEPRASQRPSGLKASSGETIMPG